MKSSHKFSHSGTYTLMTSLKFKCVGMTIKEQQHNSAKLSNLNKSWSMLYNTHPANSHLDPYIISHLKPQQKHLSIHTACYSMIQYSLSFFVTLIPSKSHSVAAFIFKKAVPKTIVHKASQVGTSTNLRQVTRKGKWQLQLTCSRAVRPTLRSCSRLYLSLHTNS
jgi:hypothetical protein